MKLDDALKTLVTRAGVVRVRNALNPLLWLAPTIAIVAWFAAYFFQNNEIAMWTFVGIGFLPILCVLIAYFTLLFKDPDRLQSEEYMLAQKELYMIQQKGRSPVPIDEALREDRPTVDSEAEPIDPKEFEI